MVRVTSSEPVCRTMFQERGNNNRQGGLPGVPLLEVQPVKVRDFSPCKNDTKKDSVHGDQLRVISPHP